MTTEQERKPLLDTLRAQVKASRTTYGDIAFATGKTTGWVGEVLRGNYPHRGACMLPKGIADALAERGFTVPPEIGSFGGGQDSAGIRIEHIAWVEANAERLAAHPHPFPYRAKQGETLLDSLRWLVEHAGLAKRNEAIEQAKAVLAGEAQ